MENKKFKDGQKVRIIKNSSFSINKVGDIGTVYESGEGYCRVLVEGGKDYANTSTYSDLELYVDIPESYICGSEYDNAEEFPKVVVVNPTDKTDTAMRFNLGKTKWSLMHYESMIPMMQVLEFGASKYAPHNWKKSMNAEEILESMQRHLAALMDGETHDKESQLHHIGHIMCNAMFYSYHNVIKK